MNEGRHTLIVSFFCLAMTMGLLSSCSNQSGTAPAVNAQTNVIAEPQTVNGALIMPTP